MTLRIRLDVPLNLYLNAKDPSLLDPSLNFFHHEYDVHVTLKGSEPLQLLIPSDDESHYRTISRCQIEIRDSQEDLRGLLDSNNYR